MKTVYIASPYTIGDPAINVKTQIDAANELIDLGFAPYAPLMTHFQHIVHPRPYDEWLKIDFVWVKKCDILLRLPGESKGADLEVKEAINNGLSIWYSIENLRTDNQNYIRMQREKNDH